MAILQMRRILTQSPDTKCLSAVRIRPMRYPDDVQPWLHLRREAFARLRLGVRDWTVEDFEREFTAKPWWNPSHVWLAEPGPEILDSAESRPVGTVALARRGQRHEIPAVHWLAVLPAWRRLGVAKTLLATLETRVWDLGLREIWLETHDKWLAAAQFYRSAGYEIVPIARGEQGLA